MNALYMLYAGSAKAPAFSICGEKLRSDLHERLIMYVTDVVGKLI